MTCYNLQYSACTYLDEVYGSNATGEFIKSKFLKVRNARNYGHGIFLMQAHSSVNKITKAAQIIEFHV